MVMFVGTSTDIHNHKRVNREEVVSGDGCEGFTLIISSEWKGVLHFTFDGS